MILNLVLEIHIGIIVGTLILGLTESTVNAAHTALHLDISVSLQYPDIISMILMLVLIDTSHDATTMHRN